MRRRSAGRMPPRPYRQPGGGFCRRGRSYFSIRRRAAACCPNRALTCLPGWKQYDRSQYRPGVYCSGILVPDGASKISTASDILSHDGKRGPVGGQRRVPARSGLCCCRRSPLFERNSGGSGLAVRAVAADGICPPDVASYAADNNCYAPGLPHSAQTFVDLDVSSSAGSVRRAVGAACFASAKDSRCSHRTICRRL